MKKSYLLIGGSLLLLLIGYQFAFKTTLAMWQEHTQLAAQLVPTADMSVQPAYLWRKSANLDKIIKNYKLDSAVFRNNVINRVSALAEINHVKLTGVPMDDPLYHTPHFIIQKLIFTGDFFDLLKMVNQLQNTNGIGMLRSVAWKQEKSQFREMKSKKLDLEVFLEIYR
ncbi:hypothetical protein [Mucilaginibacter boryungensis]|uniref:Uncharacterized protein n=1 Tax=Mucilaginibacter boryungensis TaxID=768480 RepID=A0ABR9XLI5_9SPHI|nr:hypothetical protein [Mucilaginibacter boryungensis]MBE9668247.1 hypothetical protein [Mucilaginibacter boryungensis]